MSLATVLLPLFVEVALTFALLFWLGAKRQVDFSSGAVRPQEVALRQPNWPPATMQVANAFSNQFELPILFYVLTVLEWVTRHAGYLFVILAWIFVIFRLAHVCVHVTSNIVRLRGNLYGVATLALAAMWAIYVVQVLTGH